MQVMDDLHNLLVVPQRLRTLLLFPNSTSFIKLNSSVAMLATNAIGRTTFDKNAVTCDDLPWFF